MKIKIDCMNCKGKVEFDNEIFKSQEVQCCECNKTMKVRPYKNGRITARNLSV